MVVGNSRSYLCFMLAELLKGHRKEFIDLCSAHKVKALYAFGSVVHGPFTDTSDVDLMVEVEEGPDDPEVGERLWSFWDALEALFKRPVDLLTEASVRNPVRRRSIEAGKKLIYDGSTGSLLC
jgi:predicted nucleotidyltransferase